MRACIMQFLWMIVFYFISFLSTLNALDHYEVVAINSIEKELHSIIQKKAPGWMRQAELRIQQLEKYVPRGYDQQKISAFKNKVRLDIPIIAEAGATQKVQITPFSSEKKIPGQTEPFLEKETYEEETLPTPPRIIPSIGEKQKGGQFVPEATEKQIPVVEEKQARQVQEELLPVNIQQKKKKQLYEKSAEKIIKNLEALLLTPVEDRTDDWRKTVNRHIFALAITDAEKAKEYFEMLYGQKHVVQPPVVEPELLPEQETVVMPEKNREVEQNIQRIQEEQREQEQQKVKDIIEKLNMALALPNTRSEDINDLIFELSLYDKKKAHEYMQKTYIRAGSQTFAQGQSQQKQGGGPPPPPPLPGLPGTKIPMPPTPPPLPGGKALPGDTTTKLPVKQPAKPPAITLGSLRKMDDTTLLALFDKHLQDLEKHWNEQSNEVVKVKTRYGERSEMVRGVPEVLWNNTLNTIKKVVLEKQLMSEADIIKRIDERIAFVRAEKAKKATTIQVKEEKPVEEDTQQDIERRLKGLFAEPKITEIPWLVNVKSAIKKLDVKDHQAALKYQEEFIKVLPQEKRFIKP